jgi:hypothetical protein
MLTRIHLKTLAISKYLFYVHGKFDPAHNVALDNNLVTNRRINICINNVFMKYAHPETNN